MLLAAATADAQSIRGFAANHYEPSERGSEWFANESLDLRGSGRLALGVVADYAYKPLVVYDNAGNQLGAPLKNNFVAHLGANVILAERLRLSVSLPVQLYADGERTAVSGTYYLRAPVREQSVGDIRFGADVRIAGEHGGPATLAIGAQLWAPIGPKNQYMGDKEWRFRPRLMLAGDVAPFTYAVQGGVTYRGRNESIGRAELGSDAFFAAAAGLRLADGKLVIGPELFGSTTFEKAFHKRSTPVEILGAVHYTAGSVILGLGVGPGLSRGYGAPEVRGLFSLDYLAPVVTDSDHDGITEQYDACPSVAGVASEDGRLNGCPPVAAPPPPTDRDGDGVADADDACVEVAGVRSDDRKLNGCPPDGDGDGIADAVDACPSAKGPANADPLLNGCPDTDGDGVFDRGDACPTVAGLKTQDPKTNGCPDPDRDHDGVANEQDACPDQAGKPNADAKKNGCPVAYVEGSEIRITDQVKFKTGSALILPSAAGQDVLNGVLAVLQAHPEITSVRVEGHTDSKGSAGQNKKLSADRAASVVKWLVQKGVAKSRLSSIGFGFERPLQPNDTDEGRQANRRVEFHIAPSSSSP